MTRYRIRMTVWRRFLLIFILKPLVRRQPTDSLLRFFRQAWREQDGLNEKQLLRLCAVIDILKERGVDEGR